MAKTTTTTTAAATTKKAATETTEIKQLRGTVESLQGGLLKLQEEMNRQREQMSLTSQATQLLLKQLRAEAVPAVAADTKVADTAVPLPVIPKVSFLQGIKDLFFSSRWFFFLIVAAVVVVYFSYNSLVGTFINSGTVTKVVVDPESAEGIALKLLKQEPLRSDAESREAFSSVFTELDDEISAGDITSFEAYYSQFAKKIQKKLTGAKYKNWSTFWNTIGKAAQRENKELKGFHNALSKVGKHVSGDVQVSTTPQETLFLLPIEN